MTVLRSEIGRCRLVVSLDIRGHGHRLVVSDWCIVSFRIFRRGVFGQQPIVQLSQQICFLLVRVAHSRQTLLRGTIVWSMGCQVSCGGGNIGIGSVHVGHFWAGYKVPGLHILDNFKKACPGHGLMGHRLLLRPGGGPRPRVSLAHENHRPDLLLPRKKFQDPTW